MHSFSLLENGPNRYTIRSKIQPDAGSPLDANQPIQNRYILLLLLLLPLPVLRLLRLVLLLLLLINMADSKYSPLFISQQASHIT